METIKELLIWFVFLIIIIIGAITVLCLYVILTPIVLMKMLQEKISERKFI
jgi:hypothetical protein